MFEGSQAAHQFIDRIIDVKLAGTEIEPDVRTTLHNNLMEHLEGDVVASIIALLNRHQQEELEHLIDSDQIDKIEDFLTQCGINLDRALAGVMTEFQASYLGA